MDVFISPNIYISLSNSGNVHILGNVEIKKLLAYLLILDIISKWSKLDASIPEGAINSFIVVFSKSPVLTCFFSCSCSCCCFSCCFFFSIYFYLLFFIFFFFNIIYCFFCYIFSYIFAISLYY